MTANAVVTARRAAGAPRVTRLILKDFRSYATLDLAFGRPLVALSGENGAGKTNILEALSLLSPGRGLRRAELAGMARRGGLGALRFRPRSARRVIASASGSMRPARRARACGASTARRWARPPLSPSTCVSSG